MLAVDRCILLVAIFLAVKVQADSTPSLSLHRVPIHGNVSIGYYYLDMFIGTPPQKTSLIIDTGSGVEALPCEPCSSCGNKHLNPRFSTIRSTTSKIMTCDNHSMKECKGCPSNPQMAANKACEFSNAYAEGSSIRGFYVQDIIAVVDDPTQSPSEGVRAIFGCITEETNQFLTQEADGILGLSPNRESNLLEKIYEEHAHLTAQQLEFGICFAIDGGEFSIGNINTQLHHPNASPVIVKFRQPTNPIFDNLKKIFGSAATAKFYSLDIEQMFVGGRSLELTSRSFDGDGIFVDSGATYSYLNGYQYYIVMEELDKVCKTFNCVTAQGESNRCYHFKDKSKTLEEEASRFPNISMTLPNSTDTIHWTPHNYFMIRNDTAREVCVGLQSLGRMILGSNWMTDKDLYFDLSESRLLVYDSPGCKPYSNDPPQNVSLRMMYETMMPALKETEFEDLTYHWMWTLIVLGLVALTTVISLLLMWCAKILERRENQSKEQARMNHPHPQYIEESEEVTVDLHEQSQHVLPEPSPTSP